MKELAEQQGWVYGYQDECWWSRLAQPNLKSWQQTEETELRLYQKEKAQTDPTPEALCCYGLKLDKSAQMLLRFVQGQAVSATTILYLEWLSEKLAAAGAKVLVMVWDNATWHRSKRVREWFKAHNQKARVAQKVGQASLRIIPCYLPVKSPWLNAIEPCWMHGKRAVVEPQRKLSGTELVERVCNHFGCDKLPLISN